MGSAEETTIAAVQNTIRMKNINIDEVLENGNASGPQQEAPEVRETWSNKIAYLCTLVGYAVGFGNVWRFPYVMRENGGLVFLIPYIIMLVTVGIPTFFLELAVGQRRRKGIIYCWNEISPYFGGLGICCGWICFMIGLYYNTLLAYCLSYLVDSFHTPLPWSNCTTVSTDPDMQEECEELLDGISTKYYWNRNTLQVSPGIDTPGDYNWPLAGYHVIAWALIWLILIKGTASVEKVVYFTAVFPYIVLIIFFVGNLLQEPEKGWLGAYRLLQPDYTYLKDPMTWLKAGSQIFFSLGLGMGSLVVFASYNPAKNDCHKDAVSISLINCGTSIFAALVVFPMIGAMGYRHWENCKGDMEDVLPNLKLWTDYADKKYDIYFHTNAQSWNEISERIPLTVMYGYGELNRNRDNPDFRQDDEHFEIITSPFDISDQFKDEEIFRVLKNCSIGEAATASGGGTGFVFMGFTQAAVQMTGSNIWAGLFFVMLVFLGIDSGFGTVEASVAALQDITGLSRPVSTTVVCVVLALLALVIFPFGWGTYILDLIDQWTANWTLLLIAFAECISVAWKYGLARFSYDVKLMTGKKPSLYILLCWKYLTPSIISLMLIGTLAKFGYDSSQKGFIYSAFRPNESREIEGDFDGEISVNYPWYSIFTGFVLMLFCMVWLPLQAVLRNTKYNLLKPEPSGDFPEEELRKERNMDVLQEEDLFTPVEKRIIGSKSLLKLQEYQDKIKKSKSEVSVCTKETSVDSNLNLY